MTLHSNEESYLVGNYDIKEADSSYRGRSLLTFNTLTGSSGDIGSTGTGVIADNSISGVSKDTPGNVDFSSVKKEEWITDELRNSSQERQELVKYALKFVGNPYKMGGTSLTNGIDCSAFVQQICKKFGYSIPRTSAQQRSAGKEVSAKEKKPGDIICYSGHVSIYIGDGKIVHASSRKTGIKVSNRWNYKKVITIRRVIND